MRAELIAGSVIAPLLGSDDLAGPIRGSRYRERDRAIHEFAMEDAGHADRPVLDPGLRRVGLGLHLVRELTRRFGGEVSVDSVVDRGTSFTVRIPVPASVPDPQRQEMISA